MALNPFSLKKKAAPEPKPEPVVVHAESDDEIQGARGLPSLFDQGITLQKEREDLLKKGLDEGVAFFDEFNNARMKLAFDAFAEDMKKALYEVLFFLHVNDPKFSEVHFTGIEIEHVFGIQREHEYEATANLYVEGAMHGVEGIEELPELFREDFFKYIEEEFKCRPSASDVQGFCPFVSISSLGSIGTVGHKPKKSDLDLQVQYERVPFAVDTSEWDDERLIQALTKELHYWMRKIQVKKKIPKEKLKNPAIRKELERVARGQVNKAYPQLYKYLLQNADYRTDLKGKNGQKLRQLFLHEMMVLIRRSLSLGQEDKLKAAEELLKKRVNIVQDYIQKKFPKAEIYLFLCENDAFRKGYHGTTLESKEASGSAYEMILTYDVLLPGIQFTPIIPSHFAFPRMINDSQAFYDRTMDYIRFGAVPTYRPYMNKLSNLGPTPRLPLRYILAHGGAVYWESFKASSGNLAKALLNLFRIEMLHEPKYLLMIIELIKEPKVLNNFISPPTEEQRADKKKEHGMLPWELLEMEQTEPLLVKDPWWIKFKALKVAFGELPYLKPDERRRILRIIDLCFGLHVKVSEVFVKPGDTRTFDSYRERFLVDFLRRAFPPESSQRKFLEHVNIGETKAVIEFEAEMKELFQNSLERILEIEAEKGIPDESNQKEFEIWYHYYQKNFEPPRNMIRRSILIHLKVPRLRLQSSFNSAAKDWVFRSLQTEGKLGKRFDTFGVLDELPDEVNLHVDKSFMSALAHCVHNSYYGYVNKGSLKEQKTVFEFDSASMKITDPVDQRMAYVRPDNITRLADRISEFFVYRTYHYMDCVKVPKHYLEIFFILHLMKYGRLSILYRDNLTNWYLDEFDNADLKKNANALNTNYKNTFKIKSLHATIAKFLKERKIDLTDEKVKTEFWFNPNSVETTHSASKVVAKEQDLAEDFRKSVYQFHARKQG